MRSAESPARITGAFALLAGIAGLVAGCATPAANAPGVPAVPGASPSARTASGAPASTTPGTPRPGIAPAATAPAPELSPAQAKAQAQKHVVDAMDLLQNGDEAAARKELEQALALDPGNDLARNLHDQVEADAQKELGTVFFRYTVQRDDSLSKLAQQYLGDRFKFYILAKYNDIANPGRLAAGQVIKIPGKAPSAPPAPAVARPTRPEPGAESATRAPESEPAPPPAEAKADAKADAKALVQRGMQLQKSGDLEGAYAALGDAVRHDPANREATTQREAVRQALVHRYEREAVAAFQRQNLDVAIARWTSVLDIDPGNQKARLERERAADLKRRVAEKFGK